MSDVDGPQRVEFVLSRNAASHEVFHPRPLRRRHTPRLLRVRFLRVISHRLIGMDRRMEGGAADRSSWAARFGRERFAGLARTRLTLKAAQASPRKRPSENLPPGDQTFGSCHNLFAVPTSQPEYAAHVRRISFGSVL